MFVHKIEERLPKNHSPKKVCSQNTISGSKTASILNTNVSLRGGGSQTEPEFRDGAVAFLDALGVKGIWSRTDPKTVIKAWEDTIALFVKSVRIAEEKTDYICEEYHITAFSDTLIITLVGRDKGKEPRVLLPLMAEIITIPFIHALLRRIYFRGVISIGKFCRSENFIIGPAIDEAAEWYTHPDWIGISTTPSASFGLDSLLEEGHPQFSKWFVRYNIPMRTGIEDKGWALAWPMRVQDIFRNIPGLSRRERNLLRRITPRTHILDAFAKLPIGISAISKYRNTLSFFDFVMGLKNKG
ncbi:MAG: hypothetical protein AB1393_12390 [Candidatus Edwardsbacteria bacterium]